MKLKYLLKRSDLISLHEAAQTGHTDVSTIYIQVKET